MTFTEKEHWTLINALRLAALRYAEMAESAVTEAIAVQFEQQSQEAKALADKLAQSVV